MYWGLEFRLSIKKDERECVHLAKRRGFLMDTNAHPSWVKPVDLSLQTHDYLSLLCIIIHLSGVDRRGIGICFLPQVLTGLGGGALLADEHMRLNPLKISHACFQCLGLRGAEPAFGGMKCDAAFGNTSSSVSRPTCHTSWCLLHENNQGRCCASESENQNKPGSSLLVIYFPHTHRLWPTLWN